MISLATAFFAAALAFLAKIYFDYRQQLREKRGLAAALAGEIAAYLRPFEGAFADGGFPQLALLDREIRISRLKGLAPVPAGHPVFDKVADKLGAFSISEAEGVSRFYNAVSGFRLFYTNLSSKSFHEADEDFQKAMLKTMGIAFASQVPLAQDVLRQLKITASEADWTERAFARLKQLISR